MTDVRPKMIYRKVAKFVAAAFVAAAFVAAFLSVGGSGTSVFAQQNIGVGYTSCANCSQAISFPSSNVSSMPIAASQTIYPAGQIVYSSPATQPFPTNSSFISSTFSNSVYPNQVSGTVATYPTATYPTATFASGSEFVNEGAVSNSTGTFTSMPAPSYIPAPSYTPAPSYVPTSSYVQPTSTYVQPTNVAQPVYYPATRSTPIRSTLSTGYRSVSNGISNVSSGLAQRKAQQAASGGIRGHIGGGLGGARYEGVGWSNRSPQAAIEQCCYWGTRPTAQIGVSRSNDGCWYACVLYN